MANPNVEAAYFWVQIGQNETNEKFKVKGSDFPNVAKGPEMVWVQRGDDHYWTWYGQPNDLDNPDLSYRFNYFIQNHDQSQGQRSQPDQDGQINFSLYFEAPGPYPTNEWRNIRNNKAGASVQDLDGKTLVLKNNTEIEDGDVCRITHSSGMENWYVFDTPDGNNFIKFKTLYTREDGRERVDVKRTGARPAPDGTQEVVLSIYKKANLKPYNRIADDDWVWAQGKDDDNNWQHYKVSGKNFKALFRTDQPNFEVKTGSVYFNMKMHDTSKTYMIERAEDGWTRNVSGNHTNTTLVAGNYFIPMDGCEWFKVANSSGYFDFKPNFNTSTVTCMWRTFFKASNFNGAINHFDMSNVENTQQMFYCAKEFNQSISGWNLSSCVDAKQMFNYAEAFNANVADLVFGPTCCYGMFQYANSFNQPLTNWDTANIVNIAYMFANCKVFNQSINHLDFSGATNAFDTWANCVAFNQDFSQVKWAPNANFLRTFYRCTNLNHPGLAARWPFPPDAASVRFAMSSCYGFYQSIANWTQPLPPITDGLFSSWSSFNQRVSHLDTSQVVQFEENFSYCHQFNADDIGDLNVKGIKKMARLFRNCVALNRDLSKWDVSECEDFGSMFKGTQTKYFNIGGWDVSNAKSFWYMFESSIVGDDLSGWDVRNATDFRGMFYNWGQNFSLLSSTDKLDIKIDSWDPRNAETLISMFEKAGSQTYISNINTNGWRMPKMMYNPNLSNTTQQGWYNWNRTPGNTNHAWLQGAPGFGMSIIEPGYEPTYTVFVKPRTHLSARNVANVFEGHGRGDKSSTISEVWSAGEYSTGQVFDEYQVDLFVKSGSHIKFEDYRKEKENSDWAFVKPCGPHPELMNKPDNMSELFNANGRYSRTKLSNVGGLEYINTSECVDMSRMYANQEDSIGENNDISGWDVGNVSNMDHMFYNTYEPSFGDLSGWCVKNVTSKPREWPGRNNDVVTKNPLWGQCPSDPDFVPSEPEGTMPEGDWNSYTHSFMVVTDNSNYVYFQDHFYEMWSRAKDSENEWVWYDRSQFAELRTNKEYIFSSNNTSISRMSTEDSINFKAADTSNVTNMAWVFSDIIQFNGTGLQYFDTSNVTNIYKAFKDCRYFNQDLSEWDVSKVRCSYRYDYGCNSWQSSFKPKF